MCVQKGFIMESAIKSERIDIRLSPEEKELIVKAANMNNRSLSSYILSIALKEAKNDLRNFGLDLLNDEEMAVFMDALSNPPEPNEALIDLFR